MHRLTSVTLRTCHFDIRRTDKAASEKALIGHLRIMCLSKPLLFLEAEYLQSHESFLRDLDCISTGMAFEYYPK